MEELVKMLVTAVINGGPGAIVGLLLAFIAILLWDRRNLVAKIDQKEAKLDKIIDDYYKGNVTLTEALNSLRIVLAEIKGKL